MEIPKPNPFGRRPRRKYKMPPRVAQDQIWYEPRGGGIKRFFRIYQIGRERAWVYTCDVNGRCLSYARVNSVRLDQFLPPGPRYYFVKQIKV